MPPFRTGLQKRKTSSEEHNQDSVKQTSNSCTEGEEKVSLFARELDGHDDVTDSDGEPSAAADHSDTELDEVLFNDDADSTDDDELDEVTDELSEEESSEVDDSDDSDSEGGEAGSGSDSESGLGRTPSATSRTPPATSERDEAGSSSDSESGLGRTPSATSDDDTAPAPRLNKPTSRPAPSKIKQYSKLKQDIIESQGKEVRNELEIKQNKQLERQNRKKSTLAASDRAPSNALHHLQIEDGGKLDARDEYSGGDTSDEEDRVNTCGDVPMWWYTEYKHLGYDLDGRRIMKPPQRDQIDDFLKRCEDPEFWRTVRDPATGQDVVLSAADLDLLARIRRGHLPVAEHDKHEPWVEWFTSEVLAAPVRAFPDHKRSFLPSRSEQLAVSRLVHALKMGWIKTRRQLADERRRRKEKSFYNLWGSRGGEEEERAGGVHRHIAAPRRALPSHAESYNPPAEYLLDTKEMKEWDKLAETPWRRKYTVLPTRYASLRQVPAYERFTRERFLRCLDLYLAPRAIKMRLTISPEDLVPRLPSPRDLQPFPTAEVLQYRGHGALVTSCDFDPSGQYVLSGSEDGTVKVWESVSGRCLRTVALGGRVARVAWTPAPGLSLVAAAVGNRVVLLNPGADIGAHRVATLTDQLLEEPPPQHDVTMDARTVSAVQWERVEGEEWARGVRVAVTHFKPVTHVSWHGRGDYVCVTLQDGASRAVVVHQLSRRRSQLPFTKSKGQVQCALFHPVRPFLLVATQRVVRVYDLVKQELVKKLLTGAQWISAMAMHPAGDNLLVASYDRKCIWFDLDLSSKPYQTLRLHGNAVRAVAFHRRYPLFASAGDDPYIVVSHGMVYNDLLQNPLLVPLKQLRGPAPRDQLCSTDLRWHPAQPWLLVAAADHTLRLYA